MESVQINNKHNIENSIKFGEAFDEVRAEILNAMVNFAPMNSAHEGFGVIFEEFDELKAHVWMKQPNRDLDKMRKEAKQLAAMAIRFMIEVCNEEVGRR